MQVLRVQVQLMLDSSPAYFKGVYGDGGSAFPRGHSLGSSYHHAVIEVKYICARRKTPIK